MTPELPPGQQETATFPRFGLTPFASRFPADPANKSVRIGGDAVAAMELSEQFDRLPRIEQQSDFHCVTTWSKRAVTWSGYSFAQVFGDLIKPSAKSHNDIALVVFKGRDGYRVSMLLEDLLQPGVLLADRLDGEPLSIAHGAPLRLVAPQHYGYKNAKHLAAIEFLSDASRYRPSGLRFMDHPRARVAHEERGRYFPGWLLRYVYRPLIPRTEKLFAAELERHEKGNL